MQYYALQAATQCTLLSLSSTEHFTPAQQTTQLPLPARVSVTGYSLLTIGLGASQAHNGLGSLWGRTAAIPSVRVFSVFNALGQIAFGEL